VQLFSSFRLAALCSWQAIWKTAFRAGSLSTQSCRRLKLPLPMSKKEPPRSFGRPASLTIPVEQSKTAYSVPGLCTFASELSIRHRQVLKNGVRQDAGVKLDIVWRAVKRCARRAGIENLAPHDLRRSCARLCQGAGGELEQFQFLLGDASVQTTERYIGCKQKLKEAFNDRFRI
jgi:integrase